MGWIMYFICNENDPNKWPKFFTRSPPLVWMTALSLKPSQGKTLTLRTLWRIHFKN